VWCDATRRVHAYGLQVKRADHEGVDSAALGEAEDGDAIIALIVSEKTRRFLIFPLCLR
jgi:hypothetical protein